MFCFTSTPVLSLRHPPSRPPVHRKKPRAPPALPRNLRARRWHFAEQTDANLSAVSEALSRWRLRTGHSSTYLPSDSDLRRCEIARELRLPSLIMRAGGYRAVQTTLGLLPKKPSARASKERELAELARILDQICFEMGLPPPQDNFPEKRAIRQMSPKLGNRIAAFPGRNGYKRLAEYVKARRNGEKETLRVHTGKWRFWTDPAEIRSALLAYQPHPQILPRLNTLPVELSAAIQRQGGAMDFALKQRMILERSWMNMVRYSKLMRWLAEEAAREGGLSWRNNMTREEYLEMVKEQAENPVAFPDTARVNEMQMANEVKRYGGRKALAVRLGYSQQFCFKDTFMGNFSVQLAADVLEHAVKHVDTNEGDLAMPSIDSLQVNQRFDLADAVTFFGGEHVVGRRIGLVSPSWRER